LVLLKKLVPKSHQLIDEIFGSLLLAVPINPKIPYVEGIILEGVTPKTGSMTARHNPIFEMFCAIDNFASVL